MRLLVGSIVGLALLAPASYGQITAPASVGFWISGARGAHVETRGGPRDDRTLLALGLRATWPFRSRGPVELAYTADLIPLILNTANRAYRWEGSCSGRGSDCDAGLYQVAVPYNTLGVGLAPVGLQLRTRLTPALALVGGGGAGVLYFARPVPDYEAARLNFVGDIGGGLEFALRPDRVLAVGYRFQHISNAGLAPVNVGLDTHLLLIGLVIPR